MIETVIGQLQSVKAILNVNLRGVGHEASLRSPEPAGNCLNWIVGHLVAAYDNLLGVLGGAPVLTAEQKALYERGSGPFTDPQQAMPLDDLQGAFAAAHERVIEALQGFPTERLAEPAPFSPTNNPDETMGSLIAVFAFHQAYHTGQTGLGRRLVGLDGAVA